MIKYLLLALLVSCSHVNTEPNPNKFFKNELYMEESGKSYYGVAVLPKKSMYDIYVKSEADITLLTFRTCSREIAIRNPKEYLSNKKYTIKYIPNEIEQEGFCPSEIQALNVGGKNFSGLLDYQDSSTTLPATNVCGNITEKTTGVTICQERESLLQKIKFDVEVIADPDPGCELDIKRGKEFLYNIKRGRCVIAFVEVGGKHRIHRLFTFGFENQLLSL